MTANELRQKYLDFFKSKGHTIIPSASLIPENDPTVLFTTAGMHPLVPYLLGEKHPAGQRLTNCQKCIRTGDIDEVGDATHHTFFEMLGNWSLGDSASAREADPTRDGYFKEEAIKMSWEFLTSPNWLGLDKNRLAVSVFKGDGDAPFDQEAHDIWLNLGVPEKRITRLPKKNNWWGPAGQTGPCGPDTEMFYWVGRADQIPNSFNDDHPSWVEFWNDVFMQYDKQADGSFKPLKQQNVDTGMGLERALAIMNGLDDNYRTELFWPIILKIEELSGKKYGESQEVTRAMRIIADHLKAATFIMGDDRGVGPSNVGAGYVVRRLIRRAIRYGRQLYIKNDSWTENIADVVIDIYGKIYQELGKNQIKIKTQLADEETKFKKTLEQGLIIINKIKWGHIKELSPLEEPPVLNKADAKIAFDLYQTYGFPLELTNEELFKKGMFVDINEFNAELKKHQDLSRTASAGMFKGGLADASEATVKYHTAAHLLLAALRKVLGESIVQKGSNITAERLRFDFSYGEKMTDEQKGQVEDLVNQAITQNLPVTCEEMTLEAAKTANAHGTFENKYGEQVKVYTMGEGESAFSKEICGGPHVNNTGILGHFKIQKEESSSAGVRRIKAILE